MIYIFIGEDNPSKDLRLKKIREEFLTPEIESFNLDVFYAKELNLKALQERILSLPVKAKKRIIVIKDAQSLKQEVKDYLQKYARSPSGQIVLVLDMNRRDAKDAFLRGVSQYARVILFKESPRLDTFGLARRIDTGEAGPALKMLDELLENGERPERILGGLRYAWENKQSSPLEIKKRLRLLLYCDMDIKRGRLKPEFALEKLVVKLCCLGKPLH